MLKLKLQYFGQESIHWKRPWCRERLKAKGEVGLDNITDSIDMNLSNSRRQQRRERLPTPIFWHGEIHGLHSPWGCKKSDTTERLPLHFTSKPPRSHSWETVEDRGACCAAVCGVTKSQTRLTNWTTIIIWFYTWSRAGHRKIKALCIYGVVIETQDTVPFPWTTFSLNQKSFLTKRTPFSFMTYTPCSFRWDWYSAILTHKLISDKQMWNFKMGISSIWGNYLVQSTWFLVNKNCRYKS